MNRDNMLALLRDSVLGCPVEKQRKRVTKALQAMADCRGEIAANVVVQKHHREQVLATNAYDEWWTFAYHRQALEDATAEGDKLMDSLQSLTSKFAQVQDYVATAATAAADHPALHSKTYAGATDAELAAAGVDINSIRERAAPDWFDSTKPAGDGSERLQSTSGAAIVESLRRKVDTSARDDAGS